MKNQHVTCKKRRDLQENKAYILSLCYKTTGCVILWLPWIHQVIGKECKGEHLVEPDVFLFSESRASFDPFTVLWVCVILESLVNQSKNLCF